MTAKPWHFRDPPSVAVVVRRGVVENGDWIAYVTHDADDGGWQFHNNDQTPPKESDALVLGLGEVVKIDPTILALADLPLGWHAWRSSRNSPWIRAKA